VLASVILFALLLEPLGLILAVPAWNSSPTDDQYTQAVKDAVMDFNRRAPMQKVVTLSMVSGTATYALPDDYVKVIRVASLANPSGVILTDHIIPVNASTWRERHMIAGKNITFYPMPQYTLARDVWYAAGHILDDSAAYPDMTDDTAYILLHKAQAICLRLQANKAATQAWSYSIGDESVNKAALADSLRKQAEALEGEGDGAGKPGYLALVRQFVGRVQGARATYDPGERGSFETDV